MKRQSVFYIIAGLMVVAGASFFLFDARPEEPQLPRENTVPDMQDFRTDVSQLRVPLDKLVPIGVAKDAIPSITNPQFVPLRDTDVSTDTVGVFLSVNGDKRYYPASILSQNYIVNDVVDNEPVAITHHPLSGTAVAFSRMINSTTLEFRVSGFVLDSNLVLYDTATESLWSQSKQEAVAGSYAGTKLSFYNTEWLSAAELKKKHPGTKVLTTSDTASPSRSFPDQATTGTVPFPVSLTDGRYPSYEPLYVVPYREVSIALLPDTFKEGKIVKLPIYNVTLSAQKNGEEIRVTLDGKQLPGYRQFWFSWFAHHEPNGVIWDGSVTY